VGGGKKINRGEAEQHLLSVSRKKARRKRPNNLRDKVGLTSGKGDVRSTEENSGRIWKKLGATTIRGLRGDGELNVRHEDRQ